MNRKQFLEGVALVGLAATLPVTLAAVCSDDDAAHNHTTPAAQPQRNGGNPPQFRGKRATTSFTGHLSFPPDVIFPLLCPVREYEWLEDWQCEMIYSNSGVAEDNCIFRTAHGGAMIWTVSRYEPPRRIEFTTFIPEAVVTRLILSLEPSHGGTDLQWTRIFTGLTEAGNQSVGTWKTERDAELTRKLEYYLKAGKMLRDHATVG